MKPSIPKGTRDFGPAEMLKRQFIFSVVKNNFALFGYEPIETPAMENISTLTGKYGDEGDQLIFKILNSRIHESKAKEVLRKEFDLSLESSRNSEELTEKALRYDLTVPFARYVVMHQHEITFPFKRYQVQPVWRADRPQKGRYREFFQCDADIIGSDSLLNELELIAMIDKSFSELKIPVLLKFNNRKILSAIAETINEKDKIVDITVAIDKLDKIGKDGVVKELSEKGISASAIEKLGPIIEFKGSNTEKVSILKQVVGSSDTGKKGIEEIEYLLTHSQASHATLELDITLARGLNYYTGTIFEVKANAGTFTPSILGGGRYDDLTGIFGLKNMSGVGISFGIDRIYDVMEELNLFPESISGASGTKLLFTHFDAETQAHCIALATALRSHNIACEIYPDITKKIGKQFEYADKKRIPFVCTVGGNEMAAKKYVVKDMFSGTKHENLSSEEIIELLKS
ncbi:MAG: histidine--tRNA ligase [Bacteroidia bacterium]